LFCFILTTSPESIKNGKLVFRWMFLRFGGWLRRSGPSVRNAAAAPKLASAALSPPQCARFHRCGETLPPPPRKSQQATASFAPLSLAQAL